MATAKKKVAKPAAPKEPKPVPVPKSNLTDMEKAIIFAGTMNVCAEYGGNILAAMNRAVNEFPNACKAYEEAKNA